MSEALRAIELCPIRAARLGGVVREARKSLHHLSHMLALPPITPCSHAAGRRKMAEGGVEAARALLPPQCCFQDSLVYMSMI